MGRNNFGKLQAAFRQSRKRGIVATSAALLGMERAIDLRTLLISPVVDPAMLAVEEAILAQASPAGI